MHLLKKLLWKNQLVCSMDPWHRASNGFFFLFTARKSASENELTEADQNLKRTTRAKSVKKIK